MIFGKSIEGANEEIGVYDKEAADEFVRQIDMEDPKKKVKNKVLPKKLKK